jgi:hypothetical protein
MLTSSTVLADAIWFVHVGVAIAATVTATSNLVSGPVQMAEMHFLCL